MHLQKFWMAGANGGQAVCMLFRYAVVPRNFGLGLFSSKPSSGRICSSCDSATGANMELLLGNAGRQTKTQLQLLEKDGHKTATAGSTIAAGVSVVLDSAIGSGSSRSYCFGCDYCHVATRWRGQSDSRSPQIKLSKQAKLCSHWMTRRFGTV